TDCAKWASALPGVVALPQQQRMAYLDFFDDQRMVMPRRKACAVAFNAAADRAREDAYLADRAKSTVKQDRAADFRAYDQERRPCSPADNHSVRLYASADVRSGYPYDPFCLESVAQQHRVAYSGTLKIQNEVRGRRQSSAIAVDIAADVRPLQRHSFIRSKVF